VCARVYSRMWVHEHSERDLIKKDNCMFRSAATGSTAQRLRQLLPTAEPQCEKAHVIYEAKLSDRVEHDIANVLEAEDGRLVDSAADQVEL
jgi:hypothetical protein